MNLRSIIASFVIFSLVSGPAAAIDMGSLSSVREKAVAFTQASRPDKALPLYQQLANRAPTSMNAQKDLMWTYWQLKDYESAAATAQKILDIDAKDIEALNILGQSLDASGRFEAAVLAYRQLFELEPQRWDILETLVRLSMDLKRFDEAQRTLDKLMQMRPASHGVEARLARLQFLTGHYSDSAATWARALAKAPKNADYRFGEAEALYYSGSQSQAIERLKKLVKDSPTYNKAHDFMADDALANGDYETARQILTNRLTEFRAQDEHRVLQLAMVYRSLGRWEDSLRLLKRFLNVNPVNGQALLMAGDALVHLNRTVESLDYFQKVADLNPSSFRATLSMAEAYVALKQPKLALVYIRKARTLDPTNPNLQLAEAQYLFDAGQRDESRKALTELVTSAEDPALPVLLYHGITPLVRDTLLAYSVHMTRQAFDDQMKALHEAGYQPVTTGQIAAWLKKQASLPAKPILITFDDARLDSFREADPILAKYNLKATMFAHAANVDDNLPGYASWPQLLNYRKSGRWDVQSHGDHAHDRVVTDSDGRKGIYLANKLWLPDENRLETEEEWTARVTADYARAKEKINAHIGKEPVAFSWPEGNYGQDSISNFPQAAERNLKIARQYFALAFQQDVLGLNLRTADPALLNRVQPDQKWTGKALLKHMRSGNPKSRAIAQLARQAAWENNLPEADRWLHELQGRDVPQEMLLMTEAYVRQARGDRRGAIRLAREAMDIEATPEGRKLLDDLAHTKGDRPAWEVQGRYEEDNQDREVWTIDQKLGAFQAGPVRLILLQSIGRYFEVDDPAVTELAGGLEAIVPFGYSHKLITQGRYHAFEGPADDAWSANGDLHSVWGTNWETDLSGGRAPYESARAINANIFDRFARLEARWHEKETWKGYASARGSWLSDENRRLTGQAELARRLGATPLYVTARLDVDAMEELRPTYYSPQELQEYKLGLEWAWAARQGKIKYSLKYLPGIGKEIPTDWETVHEVQGLLSLLWGPVSVSPALGYRKTPTYRGNYYYLFLSVPL